MLLPEHIEQVYDRSTQLFTPEEVESALDKMAEQIHARWADKNPLLLCVMIGGLVPTGHLLSRLDFHLELNYIHATRYQGKTRGGELSWKYQPDCDFANRHVIVVDDILDGGITLAGILGWCKEQGAAEVASAVLVEKRDARKPGGLPQADITGLTVDNHYVFGYGMDYEEYLRNAPGIFKVADGDY